MNHLDKVVGLSDLFILEDSKFEICGKNSSFTLLDKNEEKPFVSQFIQLNQLNKSLSINYQLAQPKKFRVTFYGASPIYASKEFIVQPRQYNKTIEITLKYTDIHAYLSTITRYK